MAKVGALPGTDIVDAFRGKLDFYDWCNLHIVRSWPRSPGRNRSAAVVASQQPFTYINKLASTLPADVIEPYKQMASDSGLSWKDYLNRLYINASIRDNMYPPEVTQEEDMTIIWLDAAPRVLTINNQGTSISWTDLDLTAYTSLNAKFALISLEFMVSSLGATNWTVAYLRKKGTTVSVPSWSVHPGQNNYFKVNDNFILALDDARKIQYALTLPGDVSGVYFWLNCLGYIE